MPSMSGLLGGGLDNTNWSAGPPRNVRFRVEWRFFPRLVARVSRGDSAAPPPQPDEVNLDGIRKCHYQHHLR